VQTARVPLPLKRGIPKEPKLKRDNLIMTLTALKPQTPAQVIWQDATPKCQVGDVIRKPFAPIACVVGKEILKDGRTCLIVTFPNCRDRHTEEWVVGEVAAPAASASAHTAETLKTLTWNQIQKLHTSLGLKATALSRTRWDYENRIIAAQPQPVVETEQIATPLTCATCPLARHIDGDRYCCGLTDAVTCGHWEAETDCYQEIADLETEMTELIASAEIPVSATVTPSKIQVEAPIAPAKRAMPFFFNLPLPKYVAFSEKQSVPCCIASTTRDRANEYKEQFWLAQQGYKVYGGEQLPTIECWQFDAYLQLINPSAIYAEVIKNASKLDATECLEFIIAAECPFIFHELENGKDYWNYAPRAKYVWATEGCQADIGTNVTMHDSIHAIAERIRSVLDEAKNFAKNPQPSWWYFEMMTEIGEYQKSLPDLLPITQPKKTNTTTNDDAPPNRGDNGRGRISATSTLTASTPVSTAPIRQAKQDDNFISAMVKESALDKQFYDLAYLSECQLKAQLAVERTAMGSEDEVITLLHLEKIDKAIEYYHRPKSEPQLFPAVQLEKMTELKADTLKLFKITAFDPSILPTHDENLDEQPVTEIEPEGTIHWQTPIKGTIVGKKGAIRQFYIRNDEIFIVINAGFTASETKHPNVRHQQIRAAIEAGRTFNPRMYQQYACFARETENYNGIGRIKQGQDGRWWAWSIWSQTGTGHPFFSKEIAIGYLDKMAQQHQLARQSVTCPK
jgi:hypothetical protein